MTPEDEDDLPFGYCDTVVENGLTYCVVYEYNRQTHQYQEVDRYEEPGV